MRIKSLEIHGFKSFADPGRFRFGDGITGIVGPNGCGKSNVIDAIRWCMGEMSAKNLRGRGMQDVIFAGSDTRGPSGLAEVTLTFKNDGNVPPQFAEFDEIAVTRRLHRDGNSEYLINKVACRLRDITDLFLGTGVGTRAYSIIEQGRIGFIVSSKPEERRTLIEEVAGITRFKARKKAAMKRMEVTEQNLSRVTDIIKELERQLGSLQRQAKKAERYQRLKNEVRDLDLHVATMDIMRLHATERMQRNACEKLENGVHDCQQALELGDTELQAEGLRLLEEEKRLQREQQDSATIDNELTALEQDLKHWRGQVEGTIARTAQAGFDVEDARQRAEESGEELGQLELELESLTDQAGDDSAQMELAQAMVSDIQTTIGGIDREIDALRKDALEHMHEVTRHRTHLANLQKRLPEVETRLGQATGDQNTIEQTMGAAVVRQSELRTKQEAGAAELQGWVERHEALEDQFVTVDADYVDSESAIAVIKEELSEKRARLASLIEIAHNFEGYSDGVRALMDPQGDDAGPAIEGIRGLVTDIVSVTPDYEKAVEAALGERLQALLVNSYDDAVAAIAHLRSAEAGRGGFIALSQTADTVRTQAPSSEGCIGPILDHVQVDAEHKAVVEALLGRVILVEDVEAAIRARKDMGAEACTSIVVTVGGEVFDAAGVLSGGTNEGAGLLAKQREIRELTDAVNDLEQRLNAAQEQHATLQETRLQLEIDIQQLDKDIRTCELEQLERGKDLEAVDAEVERLTDRAEVLTFEIEQHREERASLEEELEVAEAGAKRAEEKGGTVDEKISALQEQRLDRQEALGESASNLTSLKVQRASRDEKAAGGKAATQRLAAARVEYQERITRGLEAIEQGNLQVSDLKRRIEEGEDQAHALAEDATEKRQSLSEARDRYEHERIRLGEIERGLKEKRRESEKLGASMSELKMKLQRIDMDRQRVIEQVSERHDIDILAIAGDYHMRAIPGPEITDRKKDLDKSIKNIGPINLNAIEECKEVDTRYNFLTSQHEDLTKALESLRRAIQRINRTSRERFREAFESVNDMFQKVFPRLFRGGEARLELLPHDDILEAGVDIIAQPPGKKLQSVSLLSGGEKALTATAMIFAIFLIKPSPFCVLDEVDAPLDDANVGRFNDMLKEMSDISQFIVITHNKMTMTKSDRLYGITMEEPGMTKIVAVDIDSGEGSDQADAA